MKRKPSNASKDPTFRNLRSNVTEEMEEKEDQEYKVLSRNKHYTLAAV